MSPISGVEVDGLKTTVFPEARALKTSQAGRKKGKFQGEITRVTPKGWKWKEPLLW
jgi:hypothetical protein